jgi:hypothetical protein
MGVLVCTVAFGLAAATAARAEGPVVRTQSELAPTPSNGSAHDVLRRFAAAYRGELARRAAGSAAAKQWEFRAVLRPDPKHGGEPHILVVGLAAQWMGRVSEFAAGKKTDVGKEAVRAAAKSVRMMAPTPGGVLEDNPPPRRTATAVRAH